MSYYISYHATYVEKLLAANFSDSETIAGILGDANFIFPAARLITYLQYGLEMLLGAYREDVVAFYDLLNIIIVSKALGFMAVFLTLYVAVGLVGLTHSLRDEILLTRGMLSMVPKFIVEENLEVQNKIWVRKFVA